MQLKYSLYKTTRLCNALRLFYVVFTTGQNVRCTTGNPFRGLDVYPRFEVSEPRTRKNTIPYHAAALWEHITFIYSVSNISLSFRNMSIRARLCMYTPCDLSDALVKYGVKNGGFLPNLLQRSPMRNEINEGATCMVGKAYTVLYAPKSDPRPPVKQSYIDSIPKESVLILALPEEQQLLNAPYVTINNALYGGLMSTRANYLKAAGSVVLGRIRDLGEHNELGYPVWSYGVGTTAPGPVVKVVGINVPVTVRVGEGELILIQPGDYIMGDENGIVRLPVDHKTGPEAQVNLEDVLEYIPKRVTADKHVSEHIKTGTPAKVAQDYWRGHYGC